MKNKGYKQNILFEIIELIGTLFIFKGGWTLLEVYILPHSVWAEVICFLVGLLIIMALNIYIQKDKDISHDGQKDRYKYNSDKKASYNMNFGKHIYHYYYDNEQNII